MKTMRRSGPEGRGTRSALTAGALGLATLLVTTLAAGQERPRRSESADCRCVDPDGNEIADCTCLRTPRLSNLWTFRDTHVRLGITVTTGQSDDVDGRGARVEAVMRDGPADDADLREGDVITRLDGRSLLEPLDADTEDDFDADASLPVQRFLALARRIDPGDTVRVEYLRDGQTHTAAIVARDLTGWSSFDYVGPGWGSREMADRMRELSDSMRHMALVAPRGRMGLHLWADSLDTPRFRVLSSPRTGVYVFRTPGDLDLVELNPKLAEYFGVTGGVLVSDVEDDSTIGLQAGDVVLAVGDRTVDDPDQLRRILGSYTADETITFRIMRHEREMNVQGHLSR